MSSSSSITSPDSQPFSARRADKQSSNSRSLYRRLAILDDALCRFEEIQLDDGLECPVVPYPHLGRIDHPLGPQLEGRAVIDVVADILLIGENLVDRASCPRPAEVRRNAFGIQCLGDLPLGPLLHHEHAIEAAHDLDLLGRPWLQHDAIGLKALLLAALEHRLGLAVFVDQLAAQPIPGRAALQETEPDQPALPGEDLR